MALQAPLDAPAIAAGTFDVLECVDVIQAKLASVARVGGRAAFRGLRCAIRYGPVLASSHRPMMPRCAASTLENLSARWPEHFQSNLNLSPSGFASMASSVDAIHGSGPVMRRPSMDRRAFGLLVIFVRVSLRVLALDTGTTLEQSPGIPPRGNWFRFGHV